MEVEEKCPCLETCCDNPKVNHSQDESECMNCLDHCYCNS